INPALPRRKIFHALVGSSHYSVQTECYPTIFISSRFLKLISPPLFSLTLPLTINAMLKICVLLALFVLAVVEAHSWAECFDWRFLNKNKPGWSDKDGLCYGYARRFPLGHKFGTMDSKPARHYQQLRGKRKDPPCADGKHGQDGDKGSNEE